MINVLCIYNVLTNSVDGYRIINKDTDKEEAFDNLLYYMLAIGQNGNIIMDVMIEHDKVNNADLAVDLVKACHKELCWIIKGE